MDARKITPRLTLDELPAPPPGRTGWPWTEMGEPLTPHRSDGSPWPKISVVTPSYNQGMYLEETIRSILLQQYPNMEYIVVDGGSIDESVAIIEKYSPWITYWVSEKDRGQVHAINKGLARSTGELFNWINSDDYLTPGALGVVGEAYHDCDMVAGGNIIFGAGRPDQPGFARGLTARGLLRRERESEVQQMAMWVRRECVEGCGGIDESMHYAFDPDYFVRYLCLYPRVNYVHVMLGGFRKHDLAKTVSLKPKYIPERLKTIEKIRTDDRFASLREDADYAAEMYAWWLRLGEIINHPRQSGLRRAVRVALSAQMEPNGRWDRLTRRALKNLLRGREIRPYAAAH